MKNQGSMIVDNLSVDREQSFGSTLIVGAGPAAIQVAVHLGKGWCTQLGVLNRKSPHTTQLKKELEQGDYILKANVQDEKKRHLAGTVRLDQFYEGFETIEDRWDTLILCTPSDSYIQVIRELSLDRLRRLGSILLISPSIGSNLLVRSELGQAKERIEVISFSTYYAATKLDPQESSILVSYTKAFKKRVYIGSSHPLSSKVFEVQRLMESLGIQCTIDLSPLEAESKSITTYVHPPLFMSEFSLQEIFGTEKSKKFMYKLYPEGPITQHTIREMLHLWKEISALILSFGGKPINLLKFLNDDNYPVHETTLSREDIEGFTGFEPIKQEYLLYIRYTSILIDPFSTPDENGRYFDFSAVPFKQINQDQQGKWILPRIPYEDYKKLKLLYGLAQKMNLPMPQTEELMKRFEKAFSELVSSRGRDSFPSSLFQDTTQDEIEAIWSEWREQ